MSETCPVEKQQKHIALNQAIDRLDGICDKAYTILERIKNDNRNSKCDGSNEDCPKDVEPSLQEVLDNAPDRIYKKIDDMNGILDELRSSIF